MSIGEEVYELADILYKNKEYNLLWHDCIYLADQAVKQGYRKQSEGEWIAKSWTTEDDWGCYNHRSIECSVCKREIYKGEPTDYCPSCGAEMVSIKQIFNEGGYESQALKGE